MDNNIILSKRDVKVQLNGINCSWTTLHKAIYMDALTVMVSSDLVTVNTFHNLS